MIRGSILKLIMWVFIISLFSVSCSAVQYKRTLRYWTRQKNIYSIETLIANVMWRATYLSPEFRTTARTKVDEWKKLPPDQMGTYVSYLADNDPGSFIVSIYTPRGYPKIPTITTEADNFWELTLDLPTGESYLPTSVESLRVTAREARIFPYINRWSKVYRIRFPVYNLTRPFSMTLRSARATSTLVWNRE